MKTNDLYDAVRAGEINIDSHISVDVFSGPIGGHGFRSGQWPVMIDNIKFSMFSSIPHRMELAEQEKTLTNSVRRKIEQAIAGEIYIDDAGNGSLRYDPQMTRASTLSQAAATMGSVKSPRKSASSRENGKKGGRPKKSA